MPDHQVTMPSFPIITATADGSGYELPLDVVGEMALAFSDGSVAPLERMGSSFHAPAPTVQGVVPVALRFRMKPPAPPAPTDG